MTIEPVAFWLLVAIGVGYALLDAWEMNTQPDRSRDRLSDQDDAP